MNSFYEGEGVSLFLGDCLQVMREMPECSVDAVICDPPYGIRFMGMAWDGADIRAKTSHNAATRAPRTDGRNVAKDSAAMFAGKYDLSLSANQAYQVWCEQWACECLRLLKPGGHLLASGGTRTYHRLACAIEDAGFEIRDCIQWLYGSGFPKSKSVVPKLSSRQQQVRAAHGLIPLAGIETQERWGGFGTAAKPAHEPIVMARKPIAQKSVRAQFFDRYPVEEYGTGALNIAATRVGSETVTTHSRGKNEAFPKRPGENTVKESGRSVSQNDIDQTPRVGRWSPNLLLSHHEKCERVGVKRVANPGGKINKDAGTSLNGYGTGDEDGWKGQWYKKTTYHADLDGFEEVEEFSCVEGCPVKALGDQAGNTKSGKLGPQHTDRGKDKGTYGAYAGRKIDREFGGDQGSPARFFPTFHEDTDNRARGGNGPSHDTCSGRVRGGASTFEPDVGPGFKYQAKASKRERNLGLEGLPKKAAGVHDDDSYVWPLNGDGTPRGKKVEPRANFHPTCKPVSLMKWLVTLVTPPGGTCLDPFLGSGTTGVACRELGFDFIGIEMETDYMEIAAARISHASQEQLSKPKPLKPAPKPSEDQLNLFGDIA